MGQAARRMGSERRQPAAAPYLRLIESPEAEGLPPLTAVVRVDFSRGRAGRQVSMALVGPWGLRLRYYIPLVAVLTYGLGVWIGLGFVGRGS